MLEIGDIRQDAVQILRDNDIIVVSRSGIVSTDTLGLIFNPVALILTVLTILEIK